MVLAKELRYLVNWLIAFMNEGIQRCCRVVIRVAMHPSSKADKPPKAPYITV
jgi:hypothetical protein